MIFYIMTNYVKLYYDILNYTLLRSLMSPRYLVNSTECSMQKTPRGGKIMGHYIYIYIYMVCMCSRKHAVVERGQVMHIYIYIYICIHIYIYIYIHDI